MEAAKFAEKNQVIFKAFWLMLIACVSVTAYAFRNFPTKSDVSEVYQTQADTAKNYVSQKQLEQMYERFDGRFNSLEGDTKYIIRHMPRNDR